MLVEKSAGELAELLSGGEISAAEIAREYLDRRIAQSGDQRLYHG